MIKGMKGEGGREARKRKERKSSKKRGRTESGNFSFARRNVKAANEQASALRRVEGERRQLHTPVTDYTVTVDIILSFHEDESLLGL